VRQVRQRRPLDVDDYDCDTCKTAKLDYSYALNRFMSHGNIWAATRTDSFIILSERSGLRGDSRIPKHLKPVIVAHEMLHRGKAYTDEQVILMLICGDAWYERETT
jgi:hypothetical protein